MLDSVKATIAIAFLTRYLFILPLTLLLILLFFLYLKRASTNFTRITLYLNLLFLLLILIDVVGVLAAAGKKNNQQVANLSEQFTVCDTCSKPDIFLIVADEYAGKTQLKDLFEYDNAEFENALKERNFHFIDSTNSNYNATVYSMASVFNMNYLNNLNSTNINYKDILACYNLIRKNKLTHFLKENDYEIHNYSFYDIDSKNKLVTNHYFPSEEKVLTFSTFRDRIQKDLGFHLFTKKKIENILRHNMYNNIESESNLKEFLVKKRTSPAFVYTHLDMPHHSYYYKSDGTLVPVEMLTDEFTMDKNAYVEYLKYTNIKLLKLIDEIKAKSAKPPIIILMSDHGFRQVTKEVDKEYYFMNLTAVSMPNGNYNGFYNGMSSVNLFRNILNNQFEQRLPLLKDSTIFLTE